METGNIEFKRAVYLQTSTNEHKTTINYILKSGLIGVNDPLFTEIVRIELDNGFHERSRYFDYWLYFRDETNWKRCARTGLANTYFKNVFEGNISRELNLTTKTPKGTNLETEHHLVVVQTCNSQCCLVIDIFKDFYICRKQVLKHFIKDHIEKHGITKKEPINDSLICSNVCKNGQR